MRRQEGFTLIEVLVAALLMVVGLLTAFTALNASGHLSHASRRQDVALQAAEQAMEDLKSTPYANLGLTSLPTHQADGNLASDKSNNPSNPDFWVSGSNLKIVQNYNSESSAALSGTPAAGEPLITSCGSPTAPSKAGTCTVVPQSSLNISGTNLSGTVRRYVTWVNESCSGSGVPCQTRTDDAKRLTVAVVVNASANGGGVRKPVWLSSVVGDPTAGK